MKKLTHIVATARPFLAGDGTTKVGTLPGGLLLYDPFNVKVDAIHQTDWQGRIALSNQPRTNLALRNGDATTWSTWNAGGAATVTRTAAQPSPDGQSNATLVSVTGLPTGGPVAGAIQSISGNLPAAQTGAYKIFLKAASAACVVRVSLDGTAFNEANVHPDGYFDLVAGVVTSAVNGTASIAPLGSGWYACSIFGSSWQSGSAVVDVFTTTPGSSAFEVFRGDFYAASTTGASIPNPTIDPVTVTDYTQVGNQITLGQNPATGATLDWDGSMDGYAVDASATFLAQYATSPILISLIQAANEAIDQRADFDAFMANVWNVYTAVGFGLDVWGRIVNIPRTINIPASNTYLGFEGALPNAEPFNQAPFYSGPQGGTLYTLTDDAYRVLILTKSLANISSFTAQSMNALLNFMFNGQGTTRGSCYVLESATPMQISYVFNFALQSWEAAVLQQASLMPRPAGVGITITVNP